METTQVMQHTPQNGMTNGSVQSIVPSSKKQGPEMKVRAGSVAVTVWRNDIKKKDGSPGFYNTITCDRSYKDTEGNWKTTSSLRAADLPRAIVALNKAYEHIVLGQAGQEVAA